jgi:hypothetical protein
MIRLLRIVPILALAALVQGCQTAGPGGPGPKDVTPNAVTGDAIEVTALDVPPTLASPAAPVAAEPAAAPDAPADAALRAEADTVPGTVTGTAPDTSPDTEPDAVTDTAPEAAPPPADAAPAAPKSDAQIACERRRGQWLAIGIGDLRTCVFTTRDGGQPCSRASQCEGVCLARSGTRAPVRPLLGCNEILEDNGARVTLCVE